MILLHDFQLTGAPLYRYVRPFLNHIIPQASLLYKIIVILEQILLKLRSID